MKNNNLFLLGICANGVPVYDRPKSHWHKSEEFSGRLLNEAFQKIRPEEPFEKVTVAFDRVIGHTQCVSVTAADRVVFKRRKGRMGTTPFVLEREAEPSKEVTLILKKDKSGAYYVLITGFIGSPAEPEPWDQNLVPGSEAHKRAVEFWQTHALIYDSEVIDD